MTWFNNLSIKNKLILLILGITLFTQIISFSILTFERLNYLKKELLDQSHIQAKLIGEYCVSPIIFEDIDGLNQILQKIKALPFILSVAVYDQNEDLVSFHQNTVELEPIPPHEMHDDIYNKKTLHVREEINHKGIQYGQIHLRVSTEHLKKTISHQILIFALIVLGTILLIYFLALRFQRIISEPILNLAAFTDNISQTADYSLQIQKHNKDEIGTLYENFNNMIGQIKKQKEERDKALQSLKDSEEKFRSVFEQSPVAIEIYDRKGKLIDVNPKTLDMFGVNDTKHVLGFDLWTDPNLTSKKILLLKNGKPIYISAEFDFELVKKKSLYPTKRSGIMYMDMHAIPIMEENDVTGYLVQILEVTERKLAEEELKKHRNHLEELVKERTKNLEDKNKELENFNGLFVEREFRIKELREQIKILENNLINK